jgi:hypothetical protein
MPGACHVAVVGFLDTGAYRSLYLYRVTACLNPCGGEIEISKGDNSVLTVGGVPVR